MPPLTLVKTTWGCPELCSRDTLDRGLATAKEEGYQAIEAAIHFLPCGEQEYAERVHAAGLKLICQVHTTGYPGRLGQVGSRKLVDHVRSLEASVSRAASMAPFLINVHSGHDSWDLEQACAYFLYALDVEAKAGLPLSHETHRRRLLWNPWNARDILLKLDREKLKVTADLSHWVVATERLLDGPGGDDDFPEILGLVARHAALIHARVGYAQGPQVPDPAAPEYQTELEHHERWWDTILISMVKRGVDPVVETEFGPPPYLQTMPHTKAPLADLAAANLYIARRQVQRYAGKVVGSKG